MTTETKTTLKEEKKKGLYSIYIKSHTELPDYEQDIEAENCIEAGKYFQSHGLEDWPLEDILEVMSFPEDNLPEVDEVILSLLNKVKEYEKRYYEAIAELASIKERSKNTLKTMDALKEQLKNQFGLDTDKMEEELFGKRKRVYSLTLKDIDTGATFELQYEGENVIEALEYFQDRLKNMDTIEILKKIEFPMTNLSKVDKVILRLLSEIG
jgi:hypothetical protein